MIALLMVMFMAVWNINNQTPYMLFPISERPVCWALTEDPKPVPPFTESQQLIVMQHIQQGACLRDFSSYRAVWGFKSPSDGCALSVSRLPANYNHELSYLFRAKPGYLSCKLHPVRKQFGLIEQLSVYSAL